jgi:hypothetical protein
MPRTITSRLATPDQISYLISLWNQLHGGSASHLAQTTLSLSPQERRGKLDRMKAARLTRSLLNRFSPN